MCNSAFLESSKNRKIMKVYIEGINSKTKVVTKVYRIALCNYESIEEGIKAAMQKSALKFKRVIKIQ